MTGLRTLPLHRILAVAGWSAATAFLVLLSLGVGHLVPQRPVVALLVVLVVLAFGLTLGDPAVVPLLALAPVFVITRIPLGSVDVSYSDVALALAFVPAVLFGKRPYSPPMRMIVWLTVVYQLATLFTVVANPYARNSIEWFHAWLLTAGALVVGWTISREGHARAGMTVVLGLSVLLAGIAITQGAMEWSRGNFDPVYPSWPFPMQKNFVGCVLGVAAAIAYARPAWLHWSNRWALSAFWMCVLGILATQSRQALVALAAALLVLSLRTDRHQRRSRLILLTVAPALALVGTLVRDQLRSGNEFNSAFQRLNWFADSLTVWRHDPLFGVGLRWWYTDRFSESFQPPNAEMEMLSSAGILGLAAFLVMMLGALRVLWKLDRTYGTLAFAVLLSRFVQGQLDLFWVATQTSIPFLVVGICLGQQAFDAARASPVGPALESRPAELAR
jgi:polysaccharide biosynthesis protein PslJ